jgi:hypothetical protein
MPPVDQGKISLLGCLTAHRAGAYPGFCSIKKLGSFTPPGWNAGPLQLATSPVSGTIYTPVSREASRLTFMCLACAQRQRNRCDLAKYRTRDLQLQSPALNHHWLQMVTLHGTTLWLIVQIPQCLLRQLSFTKMRMHVDVKSYCPDQIDHRSSGPGWCR